MNSNRTKVAVVGATGRVGSPAVDVLEEQGHETVAISRSNGVDVVTGEGLDDALRGVDVIIDAASNPNNDLDEATAFFTAATRNLQAAGRRAGVERIVAVSIIGTQKFSTGYNGGKNAHEKALREGPLPVQILRAAQFHEFVEELVGWCTQGDVAYMPEMRTQLVAARTVAEELVRLAVTQPGEHDPVITEIAGPREERLPAVAGLLLDRKGSGVRVQAMTDAADETQKLWAEGALLPGENAKLAGPTYEEWLDALIPGGVLPQSLGDSTPV